MRIPLDLAETVAAVADEGTLDAAARRLRLTPSAVSQRIKALEEQLGRVVLVRSKPARLTEAGAAVVRMARQVALLEHDTLTELGAGGDEGSRTSVPLAVNADSLATWFLEPLARLAERHPIVFELHRDDQDFTAALLESGTVMGAVTSRATPVAGCRVSTLGAMRYEAVATPAFARRWMPDPASPATLVDAPVVDFDRRDDLQTLWMRECGIDESLPARHYVPASNDFAAAVRLGLGWALLPTFQSQAGLARGDLVRLGGPPIDVPLYWQQWNLRSALLGAIADEVVAEGRRVLRPIRAQAAG
ncbi:MULTISPECIES: LysR family transcriptional regulator ArgP [unclassified Microbacterium]|uniref:LysR family transcriptional regulator ArgP n=1 Tax=unclassified Microbacterium TaxID=2609290 RepID=UPI00214AF39B|nr:MULTISPECIES: LysR family transcriptional regulator ArgP [unclassified Microbacterium]MCR2810361.1 LysR family transcriptional regulator ArgP [Microbacterium sp. zg.B185]WIM18418.1 LysR family transcriptional regulator ArgP [Microbacterium sp. zg-B185]